MKLTFRSRKPKNPSPLWLRWAVIIFILGAVIANWLGFRPGATVSPTAPGQAASPGATTNWNLFDVQSYKARLIPGYAELIITDTQPGAGEPAICGQDATIRYRQTVVTGAASGGVPSADPQERSFRLGDGSVPEALTSSVLGMKAGGRRSVNVPRERADQNGAALTYDIELLALAPELPATPGNSVGLRAVDTRVGPAQLVRCGDAVNAHLTIWDAAGTQLLATRPGAPLTLTTGQGTILAGIEQGMVGMTVGGARTLIVPPSRQLPLREIMDSPVQAQDILHKSALSPTQVLIVDVELVP